MVLFAAKESTSGRAVKMTGEAEVGARALPGQAL
jgi:hypothetical protein